MKTPHQAGVSLPRPPRRSVMAKTKQASQPRSKDTVKVAATPDPTASPGPRDRGPASDIGISSGDRKEIAQALSTYQSDAFTLCLKTRNFHWNVTGPRFSALHAM